MRSLVLFLAVAAAVLAQPQKLRPVVLMHGLNSDAGFMEGLAGWIKNDYPGIYTLSAEVGDGQWDSFLMQVEKQVDALAAVIQADPNLKGGFDLIGHSQGGLLTRGYIERYNNPPVHNWISLAGPHGGVYGVPVFNALCPDVKCPLLADIMSYLAEVGIGEAVTQQYLSFAQYWKNPFNYSLYLNTSAFLADANNERAVRNVTYKANMLSLNHVALVLAELDEVVIPKESAHFEFYALGQESVIQNLTSQPTYIEDWLGLKTLDTTHRLSRYRVNCTHSALPEAKCKSVVYPIIKPLVGGAL